MASIALEELADGTGCAHNICQLWAMGKSIDAHRRVQAMTGEQQRRLYFRVITNLAIGDSGYRELLLLWKGRCRQEQAILIPGSWRL